MLHNTKGSYHVRVVWQQVLSDNVDCFSEGNKQFDRIVSLESESIPLEAPVTTATDDILKYFFFSFFSEKQWLDMSLKFWQTIPMKFQNY